MNTIEFAIKNAPFINKTAVNPNPQRPILDFNQNGDLPFLDFSDELAILAAGNTGALDALLDRLDIIICHGQLSDTHRTLIKNTIIESATNISGYTAQDALDDALYFMMVSPDYLILK